MRETRKRKQPRRFARNGSESDALSMPPILKGRSMAEVRAAEAAVKAGAATPEQEQLVNAEEKLFTQMIASAMLPITPQFIQAQSHAKEILARMESDGLQGFWEYIAANPPNGFTVSAMVRLTTSKNQEVAQRLWDDAQREQAATLRKRMSDLGRRPKKRNGKWSGAVRDEAKACYKEWCAAAQEPRGKHGSLWRTKWNAFAPICIARIKKKTGVDVTEDQLRRSILPVKNHPRPE